MTPRRLKAPPGYKNMKRKVPKTRLTDLSRDELVKDVCKSVVFITIILRTSALISLILIIM